MQYLTIEIKLGTIYQDQKHLEIIKVFSVTYYLVIAEKNKHFLKKC